MKSIIFFLIAITSLFSDCLAQELKSWSGRFGSIEYYDYQSSGSPENLLIIDYKNGEFKELLSNSFVPIANEFKSKFALVNLSKFDSKSTIEVLQKEMWSTPSINSTTIISFDKNVTESLLYKDYCQRFVLVNPNSDSTLKEVDLSDRILVSLIGDSESITMLNAFNGLASKDVWVNGFDSDISSELPTAQIKESLIWMDSLDVIIKDSLAYAEVQKNSGVKSVVPEVIRQGKQIEIDIQVFKAGECVIEILNLSTEVVYSRTIVLGKGQHSLKIPTKTLDWGVYNLDINGTGFESVQKFMIRG